MSMKESWCVVSLLDLPESPLENVLKRLSAAELFLMSHVCTYLRQRCTSDYLWEIILKQKWGNLIGYVARREWNWLVESRKRDSALFVQHKHNGALGTFRGVWPSLFLGSYLEDARQSNCSISGDSVMALYFSLESGRFWFPAQAYSRGGGVMICCYDVLLSYDSLTNTFQARYRHDGWRKMEENIPWDRVRAAQSVNPPDVLHCCDSLNDLVPGDHIEVQWRIRARGVPFDWWYATVGHLGSCDGNEHRCHCQQSDMLIVEFKQYSVGSPYRQAVLNKKLHDEQIIGGAGGCYGGIRKLRSEEEIARWKMMLASANSNPRRAPPGVALHRIL